MGRALSTAATFAEALARAAPPMPLPSHRFTAARTAAPGYDYQPDGWTTARTRPPDAQPHPGPHRGGPRAQAAGRALPPRPAPSSPS